MAHFDDTGIGRDAEGQAGRDRNDNNKGRDDHADTGGDAGELAEGTGLAGDVRGEAGKGTCMSGDMTAGLNQLGLQRLAPEIPYHVRMLLDELRLLQAQVDALPGPRMHQDHDFCGERKDLELLYGWLRETAWVPYWGGTMMFLGGRDPWIETLELRLWDILDRLAAAANCTLTGRGAVSPEDEELEEIRLVLPDVAAANGWVFGQWEDGPLQ